MAVSPALVWDQSPSAGQVRTSKNSRISKKEDTAVVGRVAPSSINSAESDVVTSLTSGAGDDGGSVNSSFRVLNALVELGRTHGDV